MMVVVVGVLQESCGSWDLVINSLMHFFGCCGAVVVAKKMFDEMSQRVLAFWNLGERKGKEREKKGKKIFFKNYILKNLWALHVAPHKRHVVHI